MTRNTLHIGRGQRHLSPCTSLSSVTPPIGHPSLMDFCSRMTADNMPLSTKSDQVDELLRLYHILP